MMPVSHPHPIAQAASPYGVIDAAVAPTRVFVRGRSELMPELAIGLMATRTHVCTFAGVVVRVVVEFDGGASFKVWPAMVHPAQDLPALLGLPG